MTASRDPGQRGDLASRDAVRATLLQYVDLARTREGLLNEKKPGSPLATGYDISFYDVLDLNPNVQGATIKRVWGEEVYKQYVSDGMWWWGANAPPPWTTGKPERPINTSHGLAKIAGPRAITNLAIAVVETGGAMVESANSRRRDMRNTHLPRELYFKNADMFGTLSSMRPDAMLTTLTAAPLGIADSQSILELWKDAEALYDTGLTRPNDLAFDGGRVRAAFERYLVGADVDRLRLFSLGPMRAPLRWTKLLARPGEPIHLPGIDSWEKLVHAYLPRTLRDVWSSMDVNTVMPAITKPDLAEALRIAKMWSDLRGQPFDDDPVAGPAGLMAKWLLMLPGHVNWPEKPKDWLSWPQASFPKPQGFDPKAFAKALATVAGLVVTAAGLVVPGLAAAGGAILTMTQFLAALSTTPEGAISELNGWSSRIGMPIDQLARVDMQVMKQLDTVSAFVPKT